MRLFNGISSELTDAEADPGVDPATTMVARRVKKLRFIRNLQTLPTGRSLKAFFVTRPFPIRMTQTDHRLR